MGILQQQRTATAAGSYALKPEFHAVAAHVPRRNTEFHASERVCALYRSDALGLLAYAPTTSWVCGHSGPLLDPPFPMNLVACVVVFPQYIRPLLHSSTVHIPSQIRRSHQTAHCVCGRYGMPFDISPPPTIM